MSLLWRSIVVVLFISLVFTFSLFTTTYDQPATKSKIFQETTQKLDSVSALAPYLDGDTLQVGWAAVNITPADNPSLAGYGQGKLKTVIDSIYIKTFVFSNGPFKIALITADLLIFPPLVKQLVNKSIAALGVDGIYYTATHTHHSIGNWQPGLVGYLFAGPYEEKTVSELANACKESIIEAQKNMAPSSLAFAALQSDHVYNRIDPQLGTIDPWIRVLFISQSEKKAIISSFSAHPTTIDRNNLFLHQEYPGVLVRKLEKSHAEIASFVAGAMGSQGPKRLAIESDLTREIGNSIYEQVHMISNVVTGEFESAIGFLELEIPLNEPQWRISNDFRLRPWAFDLLFGEYKHRLVS